MARSRSSGRHVSRGDSRRVRQSRPPRDAAAGQRRVRPRTLLGDLDRRRSSAAGVPVELVELERRHSRLVGPLTAVTLGYYLTFVIVVAWAPDTLTVTVSGFVTVGYLFAMSQLIAAAVAAVMYTRLAARQLDPLSDHIRERIEHAQEAGE
jgi:uncharacterized membrane protein (DUF485 family)